MAPAGPEPEAGRRERKKRATRRAIHQAALDLAEERGVAAVTVEAIAARADVATRTFFNHFRSKEEAVLGGGLVDVEVAGPALQAALAAGRAPLDALEDVLTESVLAGRTGPEELSRRMALVRAEPSLLSASLTAWEETSRRLGGLLAGATGEDPSGYPALVLGVAVTAARVAALRWAERPGTDLAAELAAAFAAVRAGLPAPDPRPRRTSR